MVMSFWINSEFQLQQNLNEVIQNWVPATLQSERVKHNFIVKLVKRDHPLLHQPVYIFFIYLFTQLYIIIIYNEVTQGYFRDGLKPSTTDKEMDACGAI